MRYTKNDFDNLQIEQALEEFERKKFYRPINAFSDDGELVLEANEERICIIALYLSKGTNVKITNEDGSKTFLDMDYTTNLQVIVDFPIIFPKNENLKITNSGGTIFVSGFYVTK